jgi:peptidoglycan/LPS O-acetylase OafA/YrhL
VQVALFARSHMYMKSYLTERENRFDQIRLGLALSVVLGHCWHISGGPESRVPLQDFTRLGFHEYAVNLFFFISGLLVTHSAFRRQSDLFGFVVARGLRIFPALIVCALTVPALLVLAGAWVDATPQQTLNYTARLISLVFVEFNNPNVFVDLPFPHALNGSVWSLRHEVGAYVLLALFVASGAFFKSRWVLSAYVIVVGSIAVAGHIYAQTATGGVPFIMAESRFVIVSFLLGVLTHRLAAWLPIRWAIAVLLWVAIGVGQAFASDLVAIYGLIVALSYSVLCIAYLGGRSKGLPVDLSYGVYIYGWPLQQLTVFVCLTYFSSIPEPLTLFLIVLPALLVVALASWVLIERPAIGFGHRYASAFAAKRCRQAEGG